MTKILILNTIDPTLRPVRVKTTCISCFKLIILNQYFTLTYCSFNFYLITLHLKLTFLTFLVRRLCLCNVKTYCNMKQKNGEKLLQTRPDSWGRQFLQCLFKSQRGISRKQFFDECYNSLFPTSSLRFLYFPGFLRPSLRSAPKDGGN